MAIDKDTITAVLTQIPDPIAESDIITSGVVRALQVSETGAVSFVMEIPANQAGIFEAVKSAAEAALKAIEGVSNVAIVMTGHADKAPPPDLKPQRPAEPQGPSKIPGVERIVAIASGKGGVGKSTVSSNLAVALARAGRKVGLLDADIYGPSQPRMMGVNKRPASPDGKTIIPLHAHGVTLMSIGFMLEEGKAVVWRGPMLMGALQQMLGQVEWGELDVLIVDLPPGTGDAQLTMSQNVPLAGAVIVSTQQDIALIDARKGLNMFRKVDVPVLGIIENMSVHICSNCGHEEHVFGQGGADRMGRDYDTPVLGSLPLSLRIREQADGGTPTVAADPDSAEARLYLDTARRMAARLSLTREGRRAFPKVVMQH